MSTLNPVERIRRINELILITPDRLPWKVGALCNLHDSDLNPVFESVRWDPATGAAASNAVNAEIVEHLTHLAVEGFGVDAPHGRNIDQIQNDVAAMSDRLFPGRDPGLAFLKLFEELGEVIKNPTDEKEWADVFILMFDLSKHYGISIDPAVAAKCTTLESRVWIKTLTGTYQHIPGKVTDYD